MPRKALTPELPPVPSTDGRVSVTVEVGGATRTAVFAIPNLRGAVGLARFKPETVLNGLLVGLRAKFGRKCHDVSGSR